MEKTFALIFSGSYKKLSKSFEALQTLGKEDTLTGLVMTTITSCPMSNQMLFVLMMRRSSGDPHEPSTEVLPPYPRKTLCFKTSFIKRFLNLEKYPINVKDIKIFWIGFRRIGILITYDVCNLNQPPGLLLSYHSETSIIYFRIQVPYMNILRYISFVSAK